jgi:hypothetical protein
MLSFLQICPRTCWTNLGGTTSNMLCSNKIKLKFPSTNLLHLSNNPMRKGNVSYLPHLKANVCKIKQTYDFVIIPPLVKKLVRDKN